MKKVMQFRYYGDNHSKTWPTNLSQNALTDINSSGYFNKYFPISQLGIQALPGTKFYLNNNYEQAHPIIIGNSGVYELNLEGIGEINELKFDAASIRTIANTGHLIIDIVYGEDE